MIYNEIMDSSYPSMQYIRTHWEDELGASLLDEEWDMAPSRVHSSSTCSRLALIQFKVIHRLHISKAKFAKIFPNINPLCDRCKQAPATILHMFWSCPTLVHFWSNIFHTISKAYDINIVPSPMAAVFGILPNRDGVRPPSHIELLPSHHCWLYALFYLSGKMLYLHHTISRLQMLCKISR